MMTSLNAEDNTLRDYTLAKQQVAAVVRRIMQCFHVRDDRDRAERSRQVLARLAEDRFNLAVVGQFKRGKSSLLNAVIGRDLLPTGLLPLTSAITALCYGPVERVVLRWKGWALEQEVSPTELADYITERGNPGNERGLIEARVELPAPFLRRGLYFVDTPGVGSSRQENTTTTYDFLSQADAVIFVTSVEAPMSEAELRFLQDVRGAVRKLFIVANKVDLLDANARSEVLAYIRAEVERTLGADDLRLFPLSALEGLQAKREHDDARLFTSGLTEFEDTLATFLSEDRGRTFLVSVLDGALRLLTEDAGHTALPAHDSGTRVDEHEQHLSELRRDVEALRAQLLDGEPLAEVSIAPTLVPEQQRAQEYEASGSVSSRLEATRTAGAERTPPGSSAERPSVDLRSQTCPVCAAQGQQLFDFFANWQHELTISDAAQRTFAAMGGVCELHTWVFERIASPLTISAAYTPLIERLSVLVRRDLIHGSTEAQEQPNEQMAARLRGLLSDPTHCRACQVLRQAEAEEIASLLSQVALGEGKETYARAEGLCLPHLSRVLENTSDRAIATWLLEVQCRHLDELAEDLRNFTLKREALRRGHLNAQEERAWRRALVQLVGERNSGALSMRMCASADRGRGEL